MPYLIGIDEAGYGPNLGPLVISGTVWRVPDAPQKCDLYAKLAAAVSREVDGRRLAIADSKALYKPGGGLRILERGVLAAIAASGGRVSDWHSLWAHLTADPHDDLAIEPAHVEHRCQLPGEIDAEDLISGAELLHTALEKNQMQLVAVRSRAVFPNRFNLLLREQENKAAALSITTLQLLAELLAPLAAEPVLVVCDKHGGRNRYQALLQQIFPEYLIEVRGEGRAESRYCWGPAATRVEVRFCAGGEAFLPAALASMTSKYLRELSMQAFNAFWCNQIPGLLPTAGYPVDARRFKQLISPLQQKLGIADELLWREK